MLVRAYPSHPKVMPESCLRTLSAPRSLARRVHRNRTRHTGRGPQPRPCAGTLALGPESPIISCAAWCQMALVWKYSRSRRQSSGSAQNCVLGLSSSSGGSGPARHHRERLHALLLQTRPTAQHRVARSYADEPSKGSVGSMCRRRSEDVGRVPTRDQDSIDERVSAVVLVTLADSPAVPGGYSQSGGGAKRAGLRGGSTWVVHRGDGGGQSWAARCKPPAPAATARGPTTAQAW